MEPNPVFVRSLATKLQRFHVDCESLFWALREMIQNDISLTSTIQSHVGPDTNKDAK